MNKMTMVFIKLKYYLKWAMSIQASLNSILNNLNINCYTILMETESESILEKTCNMCQSIITLNNYRKYNENSYSKTCKKCLNELDRIRKINRRKKRAETFMINCEKCNNKKPLKDFAKLKKFYKKKICVSCYPDFLREQKNDWCKNESNNNVNYRLKKSLAARLRVVLLKNNSTMNYIGCNIQYLKEWFEYNFTDEMNWDNYGSLWSIDHVIPVCKFNLETENEKFLCWNWTNLVPVTVKYNSSKKNSIDMNQVDYVIEKLNKFKEEGSTTKWFSKEFIMTKELAEIKNK